MDLDEECAAFIQSWLYFDLLSAVTGERVDIDSFRHRDDAARLDSTRLKEIVPRWTQAIKSDPKYSGDQAFKDWFETVSNCLTTPSRFGHDTCKLKNKDRKS